MEPTTSWALRQAGTRSALRAALLAAACFLGLLAWPGAASAKRYSFSPVHHKGTVVSFNVKGLRSATLHRAELRAASYRRTIGLRTVWRGVKAGRLRLRVPARAAPAAKARKKGMRLPRLIVHGTSTSPTREKGRRRGGSTPAKPPVRSTGTGSTASAPTTDPPAAGVPASTTPTDGSASALLAPGSAILSDTDATARVRRSLWEPRPANATANVRVPTDSELSEWRSQSNYRGVSNGPYYLSKVTGNFAGTTDEILQWTAWKWGFDEDLLRAQAVQESSWYQSAVGDGGVSFGILQIKSTVQKGTFPLSRDSTAFNTDYAAMILRHCYDGYATWLGNGYKAGDFWGCLGYFFSGAWYDSGASAYIERVRTRLAAREWELSSF